MPNPMPILLLVAALALAGCGGNSPTAPLATPAAPEPTAVPGSSSAAAAGALVTFETRGGECPQGPCGIKVVIGSDGTVERSDGMAQRVDAATMGRLIEQVEATDWETVLGTPFTGECPVNYDGQEQIFTFVVDGGPVVVASCTVAVDPSAEPFATVLGIIYGTGG